MQGTMAPSVGTYQSAKLQMATNKKFKYHSHQTNKKRKQIWKQLCKQTSCLTSARWWPSRLLLRAWLLLNHMTLLSEWKGTLRLTLLLYAATPYLPSDPPDSHTTWGHNCCWIGSTLTACSITQHRFPAMHYRDCCRSPINGKFITWEHL